ncbi:hypothetical protein [Micromonospora deserti]|uniref:Uncharacterized protein n=1 Tax=Micromonospora deserti TaxID=2070366 RepID=A0A2W2CV34_9ACTN|nr:hypothetical protein [Micromonospora deserti]PZG01741.1 hypothetical protein C1I99_05715 [Micromonospora deserti]
MREAPDATVQAETDPLVRITSGALCGTDRHGYRRTRADRGHEAGRPPGRLSGVPALAWGSHLERPQRVAVTEAAGGGIVRMVQIGHDRGDGSRAEVELDCEFPGGWVGEGRTRRWRATMGFEFVPAVLAGIVGGAVMSGLMAVMRRAGKTSMDISLIEGAMFTGDPGRAKGIGVFIHLVVLSGVVFGSIYALLFVAFDVAAVNAWWVGALIGVVHGVGAGLAMGMLQAVHPRMPATASAGHGGGLRLDPPGPFAKNYGAATAPGMLMVHVVYGAVVGLVYALIVS